MKSRRADEDYLDWAIGTFIPGPGNETHSDLDMAWNPQKAAKVGLPRRRRMIALGFSLQQYTDLLLHAGCLRRRR